jgi:hypothetical protein
VLITTIWTPPLNHLLLVITTTIWTHPWTTFH